jgi:cytochrome c oxidase assembly protein subunit 11
MTREGRTALQLIGVVVLMASLSFAAVPFYRWFCQVTGFAGTTSVATAAPGAILDRTMKVRFDASKEAGMPWTFTPMQREMVVRVGETGLAFYEAHNPTDRVVAGTATFNVTPDAAGGYFTKIACFCFTEQVLQPGETVQMPVTFFVDPAMMDDPEGRFVREITLSYTFYETALPEEAAALAAPTPAAVN